MSRRDFLRVGHGGIGVSLPQLLSHRDARKAETEVASTSSDGQAEACATSQDDGDGGGESESGGGDGDDGEPPIAAITPIQPEWWQVSLLIATIVTIAVLLILLVLWKPNRFFVPTLVAAFLSSFGISLYFNPKLWFRRMAEAIVAALVGCHLFNGLHLTIPVPWAASPFVCHIPDVHWSMNVTLGALAGGFGVMHFLKQREGILAAKPVATAHRNQPRC